MCLLHTQTADKCPNDCPEQNCSHIDDDGDSDSDNDGHQESDFYIGDVCLDWP